MYNISVKMIVGLGNPGRTYAKTRHNMGFLCLDGISETLGITLDNNKFKALYGMGMVGSEKVFLVKPQTFMNESGTAVSQLMKYYNIPIEDLLVIYDDLDLPCGKIRLREKGNDGGHNGLKSLNTHLNTKDYKRIRIGIDKDEFIPTVDYVLGKPKAEQAPLLEEAIKQAQAAAIAFIKQDFRLVMNDYNIK